MDFEFKSLYLFYYFYILFDFSFLFFLYRDWVILNLLTNQDDFEYEPPTSKGGKPKRSVKASVKNIDGASASKPPPPWFVLL